MFRFFFFICHLAALKRKSHWIASSHKFPVFFVVVCLMKLTTQSIKLIKIFDNNKDFYTWAWYLMLILWFIATGRWVFFSFCSLLPLYKKYNVAFDSNTRLFIKCSLFSKKGKKHRLCLRPALRKRWHKPFLFLFLFSQK